MATMHLVTGYKGEAHVSAADMGSLYAAVFGPDTYVLDRGSKLAASVITNNTVRVSDGDLVMQGRHIRLENAADLTVENGAQGYYRHDLIVVRYAKDTSSGQESAELAVLKGTAALTTPEDPSHTAGDILSGAAKAEVPLYRIVLNGLNIEELAPLCAVTGPGGEPGISVYTHNKSGSTHDFVGVGSNGKALIKHTFASGDQIAVNGKVVPAFVGADAVDELPVGRWAYFAFDGAQLNFKGGGGLTNTKLSAATATAADVLSGKTFYAGNKTRQTGALPVYSNQYIDANSISVKDNLGFAINRGAYTNSNTIYVRKSVSEVADAAGLTEDKLVSGQTVLGVTGTGRSRVETICTIGTNNSSYSSACNQKSADTTNMTMTMSGAERTVTFKNAGYFTWHTTGTNGTSVYTNSTYTKGLMNKVAAGESVTFGISGSGSNFFVLSVAFMPE